MKTNDITEMVAYIQKHLNNNQDWFDGKYGNGSYRDMYLSICNNYKTRIKLSDKQKAVLVLAYNKIFDKVSPCDSSPNLF